MANPKDKMIIAQNCKLVLGTAQLGMYYGIANKTGQPNEDQALEIVRTSWSLGIREFDSAQAYGISEQMLGDALTKLGFKSGAAIISKLDPALNHLDHNEMNKAMERSLKHLGLPKIKAVLIHREEYLDLIDKGLHEILTGFIKNGLVENVGVSVYTPEKAIQAIRSDTINIIQVPTNILDRRFEDAGIFDEADRHGKELYVRSIFLQGLLLEDIEAIPSALSYAKPVLSYYAKLCADYGITRHHAALGYVKARYPNVKIIFGAETLDQVRVNCLSWTKNVPESFLAVADVAFKDIDEAIVNPALWPS